MIVERIPADVSRETFIELGGFLIEHSRELAPAPVDMNAATGNGYGAIAQGMTLVARSDAGDIIGSLALVLSPLAWCTHPDRKCLIDYWYVIAPDHRHSGVNKALEAEAAKIGAESELPVFVSKRRRIS